MIEYTRCPKCGTLFDVSDIDFSDSKGWVQCGDCTHQFRADQNAVNYSALLEQSILANMDEMTGSKKDFSLGQLALDNIDVTEATPVTVSENIDLFDSGGMPDFKFPDIAGESTEDPHSDYVETEFEPAKHDSMPDAGVGSDEVEESIVLESSFIDPEDVEATAEPEQYAESISERLSANQTINEQFSQSDDVSETIYAGFAEAQVESFWSRILLAILAVPFMLALLLALTFQLQQRGVVDWVPESYQQPLKNQWLSFLDISESKKVDLSKIHLSSTRMESHSSIAGAKTIVLQLINRAEVNQAFPDFEVSLTDGNGSVVARRILQPFDYLDEGQLNMLESKQAKTLRLNFASLPEGSVGYEIQVTRSRN